MGLSPRNLWDMKKFYLHYKEGELALQDVNKLSTLQTH